MNPRILIIDDEESILEMLKTVFRENGYDRVSTATEYQSMLPDIFADVFDLILCDIMLGKNTGIDFLNEMKNGDVNTPLVLMTGRPDIETAIAAIRLGAFDYLRKPIKAESLLNTVQKALAKRAEMETKQKEEAENKIRLNHVIKTYRMHLQKMREEIDSATDIYNNLVNPDNRPLSIDVGWRHLPLAGLGGDFIDIRETENMIDIMLADVAGHDIGSSYHTILLKAFFEENCRKGNDGTTLFRLLNKHTIEHGGDERMITAVFLRVCPKKMMAEAVCAAHPWIVLIKRDTLRPVHLFETGGDVLGIYENPVFASKQFQLDPGDRLFIYTDGVANASKLDSKSSLRKKMELPEFDDIFLKHRGGVLEEMVSGVWRDILDFCENKPRDDMLFMGLEIPN